MKIAMPADGPDLDARVEERFGLASYLLIVDLENGDMEAVPGVANAGQRGAGIRLISIALSRGVGTVLTGYCSPALCSQLEENGVEVIAGVEGKAGEAVERYKQGLFSTHDDKVRAVGGSFLSTALLPALQQSARQFLNLLPVMLGVVLLIGLFNAFVSADMLSAVFSGKALPDTLLGACFGSLFAGNPVNSYIIGAGLLDFGISLFAVTAFMMAWVTVGLVQLPAEIAAFGKKFALLRNGFSFLASILIALITVWILQLLGVNVP